MIVHGNGYNRRPKRPSSQDGEARSFRRPRPPKVEAGPPRCLAERGLPLLTIDVFTLFPNVFKSPLGESILKIAQEKGLVQIRVHNLRDYTSDRHRTADDKPFGGGPGMVMKLEPIDRAFKNICTDGQRKIFLTPQGRTFTQDMARRLAQTPKIALLCGHYEGVDERVREGLIDEEIALGDFVLTGGEIPALCVIDAVTRLVPGVLGNTSSLDDESFNNGTLDYPHYTRPRVYQGKAVPETLVSGNHKEIDAWRKKEAAKRTRLRRPDLLDQS